MSQQKKLEKVLDLLLSEDSDQAAELLHQIIVEKARNIYESIVDEEDEQENVDEADEVGGEPNKDFTDEISSDKDEVDADEHNDGEAGDEEGEEEGEGEFGDEEDEEGGDEAATKDDILDLKDEIVSLRDEFERIMNQEMGEPEHAGMDDEFPSDDEGDEFGVEGDEFGDEDQAGEMPDFGGQGEQVVGEVVARFEAKKDKKLPVAPQAKDKKKDKKVDEETKFLNQVADTGQRGTAKLVGTGKGMTLGAEQTKSSFTTVPPRKDYGGKPTKVGGDGGTGGEYGKYNGDSAADKTPTDNVNIQPKKNGVKADTTAKFTGGKVAGDGFSKSPLSKKPSGAA